MRNKSIVIGALLCVLALSGSVFAANTEEETRNKDIVTQWMTMVWPMSIG